MTTGSGFSDCLSEESLQVKMSIEGSERIPTHRDNKASIYWWGQLKENEKRGRVKYYHCTVWIRRSVPNEKTSCGA